jgi:formylglycine-generating enzyme required for sulfatase activity
MRVFLSYSSSDRTLIEPIYLALCAQGHTVFFDRAGLSAGQEYDVRIRRAIENSHLMLFMVSPESLDAGSYTLTELAIAQKTWQHPAGRVLPVILRSTPLERIPPYLKSVTLLEPEGDLTASVADQVYRIAETRRGTKLKKMAAMLVIASIICSGAYGYWRFREQAAEVIGQDGAVAVIVPAGNFVMGDDLESAVREIYLDSFYIDKYEVTLSRYTKYLEATGGARPPQGWRQLNLESAGELPVVGVDWHDAEAYCRWAGKRLPTESEWEKAARGGDGRSYPWGSDEPAPAHANFAKSADGPYTGGLAPVESHAAGKSPYGIHDLAGNASEWVSDWFAPGFVRGQVINPKGPEYGTAKVIRGGGWYDPPERLNSSRRMHASPATRADDLGFRCAKDSRQ